MKKSLLLILLIFTQNIYAGEILNKLKKIPASKYQLAIVKLEMLSYMLTQDIKNKQIPNTSITLKKVSVIETKKSIYFQLSGIAKAKDLTDEQCSELKNVYSGILKTNEMAKHLWPKLSKKEYELLNNEFMLRIKLTSQENSKFKIKC